MKFADKPAADRWNLLDSELPKIIAAHVKAADVDPSDEVSVQELAHRHRVTEAFMVKRLRALGGQPYAIGAFWFIRRRSLVLALETAESTGPQPCTRKRKKPAPQSPASP